MEVEVVHMLDQTPDSSIQYVYMRSQIGAQHRNHEMRNYTKKT